jgi:hypothetical protein
VTEVPYVEEPEPDLAEAYRQVRETVDPTTVAKDVGVRVDVVERARQHLFLTQHDVTVGPNDVRHGYFTPVRTFGELWLKARDGTLDAGEAASFRRHLSHEYIESKLMERGLQYRSPHPSAWSDGVNWSTADHYGAHDLAPHGDPKGHPFKHWPPVLGRQLPDVAIAPDLSNLDEIAELILREERDEDF